MFVSIQMTEKEMQIAKAYAKKNGLTINEAMKRVFFDAIEEECDIVITKQALKEHQKDPITFSHKDVCKMFD